MHRRRLLTALFTAWLAATLTICACNNLTIVASSSQKAANRRQPPPQTNSNLFANPFEELIDGNLNLTQLLFDRFASLFAATRQEASESTDESPPLTLTDDFLVDGFAYKPQNGAANGPQAATTQSPLDARNDEDLRRRSVRGQAAPGASSRSAHFFRVLDRVFSRAALPEPYKQPQGYRSRSGYCANHIGCVEELPNFPSLLKKPNVSTSFTIYTSRSPKVGHKIAFEPVMHYQLQDVNATQSQVQNELRRQLLVVGASASAPARVYQRARGGVGSPQSLLLAASNAMSPSTFSSSSSSSLSLLSPHTSSSTQLHQQATNPRHASNGPKPDAASSWRSLTKIAKSHELPFDLSAIEASGFNASRPTRVIVGGYFAKEDEAWIEDLVKHWMLLQPDSNVIKVSWADSNRGLYHTAAYNSRIVGRQMTLFIYYLDQLFGIDLGKFHLVGHSLGAHIAGFVGADLSANGAANNSKLARITGLDPAGPIFVELNSSMRLDPTDATFVDVIHTNGGPILKGALGLSAPSGHVDYFPNGNTQPGCYFSSMTKPMIDPVERVACNHRRSYRYFIEIIRLTASEMSNKALLEEASTEYCRLDLDQGYACEKANFEKVMQRRLPRAFLFEVRSMDELSKLNQPELVILMPSSAKKDLTSLAPLKKPIEFHTFKPDFPVCCKRGLYYFKTRYEAPFFAAKQHALTLRTDALVRKKISLTVKFGPSIVAEADIDEILGYCTLIFVPNASVSISESDSKVPQMSLMWKYRSFNLLLNQQSNELHLTGLELSLIDTEHEPVLIRYNSSQPTTGSSSQTTITTATTATPVSTTYAPSLVGSQMMDKQMTLSSGKQTPTTLTLSRNQWYKFSGFRLVADNSNNAERSDLDEIF